jgi:predicted metal-binding membrane protein
VRAGLAHGAATLRCCGPLMALMALGLAGPAWMPLLGGVMAAEAATPVGARLRVPLGVALLLASPLVLWAGHPPA